VSAEERVARRCHGCGLPIPDGEKAVDGHLSDCHDKPTGEIPGEWGIHFADPGGKTMLTDQLVPCPACGESQPAAQGHAICLRCEGSRPRRPKKCEQCRAGNPYLTYDGLDEQWICEHRHACEARQMLADGAPSSVAATHAQQGRSW
jgi:hypothetical protein